MLNLKYQTMNDNKKRKYRVNDKKRRKIKIGDIINFTKLGIIVTYIQIYNDFKEAATPYFNEAFSNRYDNIDSLV